jgi:multimeric flavodoxin WrbA
MKDSAQKQRKNLLIVSHSQSGKTQSMAAAVLRGCQQHPSVSTRALTAADARLEDLLWAGGLLFGTPENFGTMSGMLKDFFDRTYYPAEPYKINLPYAIFVSSSNDGSGAVRDIQRIARGYPLREVSEPLICKGELTADRLVACEELGLGMATGIEMGIF